MELKNHAMNAYDDQNADKRWEVVLWIFWT